MNLLPGTERSVAHAAAGWTQRPVAANLPQLHKTSRQRRPGAPQNTETPPAPVPNLTAKQKRWFRLALLVVPVALLLAVEGALRLTGFGYSTGFFKERTAARGEVFIENRDFGRRFFPPGLVRYAQPLRIAVPKPPDTLRVFVFGESAAMGDPDFKFGLPRMLQVLLREKFPDRHVEVINLAMVAINSHVILPIARDGADKQADLWVIYMGNNEMIGPFGSASVFGAKAPPLWLVHTGLWLKSTRTGQLIDALLQRLRQGNKALPEWSGMEMMAQQKVRQDSAGTQRVYRHFERNLSELLSIGAQAGLPMILCTVGTNLRDCSPFASLHRPDLSPAQLAQWDSAYQAGVALQDQGKYSEAGKAFERAAQIDGEFADLNFREADCWRLLGETNLAATLFSQARDQDALQFRADGRINETIRQLARRFAERQVRLVDADRLFATNSPQGLTGGEYFYEHVHLTPEGNYLLARAIAEGAAEVLGLKGKADWLTRNECFGLLGLTDWNRYEDLNVIWDRVQRAPFTTQLDHARQLEQLSEQQTRYRLASKPAELRRQAAELTRLVGQYPQDPDLRWNLAPLLESVGNNAGAEEQWRALARLQPQAALPVFNLARLVDRLGRPGEALPLYRQCLELDPEYYPARYGLGSICLRDGELSEALHQLEQAVRQKPQAIEARLALAEALSKANKTAAAEHQWRQVLKLDPENNTARQGLGWASDRSAGH